jgi:predicted dienelactone hydrolase
MLSWLQSLSRFLGNWKSHNAGDRTALLSGHRLGRSSLRLGVSGIGAILLPILWEGGAIAADRIYVTYGPFEGVVSVDSLEEFVANGEIGRDLAFYAQYASDEQLEDLQNLLITRAEVSPVAIAQFLYTPQGEALLDWVGEMVQTESRQSGFYALRSALILAAADEEDGLTPLNVLHHFPLSNIRIDVERTLEIAGALESLIWQTNQAIATIEQQSALEAAQEPAVNFDQRPDLRQRGSLSWQKRILQLTDTSRNRRFETDLYLPEPMDAGVTTPAPVIVISHGLGSDRTAYAYLAEHLASYGYAVAVVEHPGSNSTQIDDLLKGRASQVAAPSEFIDRPLDIQFVLDSLENRSQNDPQLFNRFDLEQVGIIGQSFGGYTALALAGAQINPARLQQDCPGNYLNLSLLLQCQALDLEQPIHDFRDRRVKAIIVINPIGGSLLGESGFNRVQLPVMMVTGDADTVAPSLLEQIYPFTWLDASERYLLLLRGATHFSTIGESGADSTSVPLPPQLVGPSPSLARRYLSAMSLSFLRTHIEQETDFDAYLRSGYARYLSRNTELPLRLVRDLSPTQLTAALETVPNIEVASHSRHFRLSKDPAYSNR